MKIFFLNILLVLLIIVLFYFIFNTNNEAFNCDISTQNINNHIERQIAEENPTIAETSNNLDQLFELESKCNDYLKQQQETVNKDIIKMQNKQKNILNQQKRQIQEYKKLLAHLMEVYKSDNVAVSKCVESNTHNIDMDTEAIADLGELLGNNKLEILLKK